MKVKTEPKFLMIDKTKLKVVSHSPDDSISGGGIIDNLFKKNNVNLSTQVETFKNI